jgi:hypothetical protein
MENVIEKKTPAPHLLIGLGLIAIFWYASWTHLGVLGEYSFFPLWLGYILTVDALVVWRTGTSVLTHNPREFIGWFLLSTPVWWIFEFHNYFLENWHYLGARELTFWEMVVVGTLDFSTVVPAVFETAALIQSFEFINRFRGGVRIYLQKQHLWLLMYIAVALFAGVLFLPRYFFAFTWIWLFLFVDALNFLRGRASLLEQATRGDWRTIGALALAGVVCGFFWEMWNIFALPKWYYTVPFVGFGKIFEMPILGYGGYIPFAWELYALYRFIAGVIDRQKFAKTIDKRV